MDFFLLSTLLCHPIAFLTSLFLMRNNNNIGPMCDELFLNYTQVIFTCTQVIFTLNKLVMMGRNCTQTP